MAKNKPIKKDTWLKRIDSRINRVKVLFRRTQQAADSGFLGSGSDLGDSQVHVVDDGENNMTIPTEISIITKSQSPFSSIEYCAFSIK